MPDEPRKPVGMFVSSDPDRTSLEQPYADPQRRADGLPLRLLLASDLAPQAGETDWPSGPSRLEQVDRQRFAEYLQRTAPRLRIEVPNMLGDTPKLLDVDLSFSELGDFHPEAVARQVPPLARLLDVRTLVAAVGVGEVDLDAFRARMDELGVDAQYAAQLYEALAAPPTETPEPPQESAGVGGAADMSDTLRRLLGMVDAGTDAAAPAQPSGVTRRSSMGNLVDTFVGAVAGAGTPKPRASGSAAGALLVDLDAAIARQLGAIFEHPAFRSLEAAWRGLKFLVDRIDFRKNIRLEVLPVGKEALDEALYYQVLLPEHAKATGREPLSALIADFAFGNGADDIALLGDLAETCASLQAPLVAAAAPDFFGVRGYGDVVTLPPLWQHVERPEYIAWNKLRQKPEARYISLALPAFALRYAYGDDAPVRAFAFEEQGPLWGNAALAVAVRMAHSFAATGWPTHLVGNGDRRVDDLPLWRSSQGRTPLAALVPDAKLAEFAKGGFTVLGGRPNHDALHIARAQTIAAPEAYEDLMAATEARIHVTLPCQLFVARAAQFVIALQEQLPAVADVEQVRQDVEKRLRAMLHVPGQTVPREAVEVEHVPEAAQQGAVLYAVRLRPPTHVLDRPVSLVMGLQLSAAG